MREPLPSVSVVVATHNRRANLTRVITPLLADPATTEVVVVADGCVDGSNQMLLELASRDSRLKPLLIENRGTARAQQAGVERASCDVVLLIDDDVIAAPGLVTGHAQRHAEAEGRVVIGYMPVRNWQDRPRNRFATYLYAREYEAACERYEQRPDEILLALWGGNVSFRRVDCHGVPLHDALVVPLHDANFAERYHMDREFGIRCLKAGLVGVFDRSLLAEHAHERSLDGAMRDAFNQGAGRVLLHRVHGDVIGPFDRGRLEADLPAPVRVVVRLCRRPRAHRIVAAPLRRLVTVAGRLGLFPLELRAGQLLRRIELQRGALSKSKSRAVGKANEVAGATLVLRN